MLLFTDFSEKIIYAISCVRLDDTLCLCEGSLFNGNDSISCGFYRTCSIPCTVNINTNELLSQFEMNFEQFISDGREFKTEDINVKYAEMQSGIVFENPISAITEYAQQNNLKIIEVVFVDPEKEYYGEIISKIDMTAENNYQGFHLGSAGSGGKIEPKNKTENMDNLIDK